MKQLRIEVTLLSDALIGSGEGFGALIDSDIVFDEIGIPLIPARRMKGCLKEAAEDVQQMFTEAGMNNNLPLKIDGTFGKHGEEFDEHHEQIGRVRFSNLTIAEYAENQAWLRYLSHEYKTLLSQETIMNTFTQIRQQTAIDEENGVAKDSSLRIIRVARKNSKFCGEITVASDEQTLIDTLAFACSHLRHIGANRNRGFGEVSCQLFEGDQNLTASVLERLEGVCKA